LKKIGELRQHRKDRKSEVEATFAGELFSAKCPEREQAMPPEPIIIKDSKGILIVVWGLSV
jgi:hypothetical protein